MIAAKDSQVYVVDDNPGRAGSGSTVTLWHSARDAVLVFLAGNRGHFLPSGPHGKELIARGVSTAFRNPEYPENAVETTEEEVTRLAILLEHQRSLTRYDLPEHANEEDDLDDDYDPTDDGYCDANLLTVR